MSFSNLLLRFLGSSLELRQLKEMTVWIKKGQIQKSKTCQKLKGLTERFFISKAVPIPKRILKIDTCCRFLILFQISPLGKKNPTGFLFCKFIGIFLYSSPGPVARGVSKKETLQNFTMF